LEKAGLDTKFFTWPPEKEKDRARLMVFKLVMAAS